MIRHNIDGTDTKQPNSNSADLFFDIFSLISNEVIIKVIKSVKFDSYPGLDKIIENEVCTYYYYAYARIVKNSVFVLK